MDMRKMLSRMWKMKPEDIIILLKRFIIWATIAGILLYLGYLVFCQISMSIPPDATNITLVNS